MKIVLSTENTTYTTPDFFVNISYTFLSEKEKILEGGNFSVSQDTTTLNWQDELKQAIQAQVQKRKDDYLYSDIKSQSDINQILKDVENNLSD